MLGRWKLTEATSKPTRIPTNNDPAEGSFPRINGVEGFILAIPPVSKICEIQSLRDRQEDGAGDRCK